MKSAKTKKSVSFSSFKAEDIVYVPSRDEYTNQERRKLYYTDEELHQTLDDIDLEEKFKVIWKKCVPQVHECRRSSWCDKLEAIRKRKEELQRLSISS